MGENQGSTGSLRFVWIFSFFLFFFSVWIHDRRVCSDFFVRFLLSSLKMFLASTMCHLLADLACGCARLLPSNRLQRKMGIRAWVTPLLRPSRGLTTRLNLRSPRLGDQAASAGIPSTMLEAARGGHRRGRRAPGEPWASFGRGSWRVFQCVREL